jgi:septal ring factor EnvC (AmiA/AmiB activator)
LVPVCFIEQIEKDIEQAGENIQKAQKGVDKLQKEHARVEEDLKKEEVCNYEGRTSNRLNLCSL